MSPPSFPRTCPCSGAPFPPRGPSGWFPRFLGTVKHSDFLPSLPRCFVAFASRYRHAPWASFPQPQDATAAGRGLLTGLPNTGFIDGGGRTSQVPGGPHCERALLCDPGGTSALGHCHASVLSSAIWDDVDSHDLINFEAQSHGPLTHCLRFAGWVAPPPRKTRFRMAGQPCPGGNGYPLGPNERFQVIPFPFPRLRLAHPKLTETGGAPRPTLCATEPTLRETSLRSSAPAHIL